MARLIINNYSENQIVKEKVLGFIPNNKHFIHWYLSVNRPDKAEERIFLGKQIMSFDMQTKKEYAKLVDMTEDQYIRNRTLKIQELVNNLEKEGYYVSTDQLALFINCKIDNLILDKKK